MNLKDFANPTILTAQQYGTKVTVELDHSDTSLDELFDAFQTICIGLGYHIESWNKQIKGLAEEMIEEENESLKEKLNEWKNIDDDTDVKARWDWDYTEDDEERMNIIGQNGNDGLHYDSDGFESYQNLNDEDYDGQFEDWDNETPEESKPNKVLIDAKKQYEDQIKNKTKKNSKKTKKTSTKNKTK
jgi:hypothetical protein